jgi:hypothetical protein
MTQIWGHVFWKDIFRELLQGRALDRADRLIAAIWFGRRATGVAPRTVPTTLAGLLAMLVYADEITHCEPDVLAGFGIFSTLATAAKSLSKGDVA